MIETFDSVAIALQSTILSNTYRMLGRSQDLTYQRYMEENKGINRMSAKKA